MACCICVCTHVFLCVCEHPCESHTGVCYVCVSACRGVMLICRWGMSGCAPRLEALELAHESRELSLLRNMG